MIELHDISFHYQSGEFSLHIPELIVAKGEKIGVIGPSGSGKTTLLNLVSGILSAQNGTIYIDGQDLTAMKDKARRNFRISTFGFIFQEFGLIDYLDVLDNIIHPYRITPSLKLDKMVREKAKQLTNQMGIAKRIAHFPSNLSHGEKQRVAICRALLSTPKIILADEATGNLDPKNKIRIMDLLLDSARKNNTTLLAVTHDQELLSYFDRIINFNDFLVEGDDHA